MSEKKRYDTWTYASANSVTVPGDLSGTYWPGMRVALKQGTVKHFLIEEVVYNGTTQTTITLNGMGVYTLTSDPITAHIDTVEAYPKGFPFAVSTETVPGLCPALTGDETKFLRSDGSWEVPGDVSGPSSSVDGNIAAFDGTDGKKIKDALYPVSMFADGWIPAGETWTYASADDPTYTFTISGDKTGKYGVGMRIKLTQTSAKYFIITKVEYSSPNTTVTVYGGTDYDLADATISSPYYSREKAPLGFPLDPDVSGPSSSVDGNIAAFDGVTGKAIKDSLYPMALLASLIDGWVPAGETWTYASADDPTFTFTISGDLSAKYYPGMKIKLTQTTAKYFIITAVSYGAPNTTVTVYGGTDYDLADAAITLPYYSMVKSPTGFPMDPGKWQVKTTYTTYKEKTSTGAGSVYYTEFGGLNISVPIGLWNLKCRFSIDAWDSADDVEVQAGMSTANNAVSSEELIAFVGIWSDEDIGYQVHIESMSPVAVASKTPYYFVVKTLTAIDGVCCCNDYSTFVMLAECAYL